MTRAVSWKGLSVTAVIAVGTALAWGGVAAAADGAEAEVQSSLVEDFAYPAADAILAEHGLKVATGDGHILFESTSLTGCARGLIGVETHPISTEDDETADEETPEVIHYCFSTSGTRGFLTLEVPTTAAVRAGNAPVEATALLESGVPQTYDVPANRMVDIDIDPAVKKAPKSILLELRFGTW